MKLFRYFNHPTSKTLMSFAIIGLFLGFIFSQFFPIKEKEKEEKREKARIYQVGASIGQSPFASARMFSPLPLADALSHEFGDQVQAATRLFNEKQMVGRYEGRMFTEQAVIRSDEAFFEVFEMELVSGETQQALSTPNAVVMTSSCAKRYFGEVSDETIGKTVLLDHKPFEVTAIVEDTGKELPGGFDMVLPLPVLDSNQDWSWNIVDTYLKLDESACPKHLLNKLPHVVEKYARPQLGTSFDKWRRQGGQPNCFLEAV